MKTLFVFNHPAPYKVKLFNELNKLTPITVIFERKFAKNRTKEFYKNNKYEFEHMFLSGINFGNENSCSFKLKTFIKKHHKEYSTIVMNGYSTISEIIAIKYMIKKKIPYALMVNGGVIKNDPKWKKKLKITLISDANLYFSPNEDSNKYLLFYGAEKDNIRPYHYSNISESNIVKNSKNENDTFLSIGQFIERKNNEQLIDIFKNRDERLLIIGSGKLKNKYQKLIGETKNIEIIDYLAENKLFELMSKSKALITLSKEDIFGHTIVEALANGLPIISSDKVLSARQIIKNDYNGYVVHLKNEEIIKAISNIEKINRANCIESIKEFTIEQSAKDIFKVIK